MNGLFIPEITAEMFRNGCLESIEALMAEGEIYDIDYSPWIPCSERLPEEHVYCLCCDKDGYMTIGSVSRWSKEWCFEDDEIDIDVVAWMPLPEPFDPQESEG